MKRAQRSSSAARTRELTWERCVGDSLATSLGPETCLGNKVSNFPTVRGMCLPNLILPFVLKNLTVAQLPWYPDARMVAACCVSHWVRLCSGCEEATQERTQDLLLCFVGWLDPQRHLAFLILFAFWLIFLFWKYFLLLYVCIFLGSLKFVLEWVMIWMQKERLAFWFRDWSGSIVWTWPWEIVHLESSVWIWLIHNQTVAPDGSTSVLSLRFCH